MSSGTGTHFQNSYTACVPLLIHGVSHSTVLIVKTLNNKYMRNSKEQMIYVADKLRDLLDSIENILEGYDGIEGNKSYVKYCYKKAAEVHNIDDELNEMIERTYAVDLSQRKGINIARLISIIKTQFMLLDDIDTASDMFKPTWCKITSVVSHLQQLRWIYCSVESEKNDNGDMIINGECFKKEDRIILSLS